MAKFIIGTKVERKIKWGLGKYGKVLSKGKGDNTGKLLIEWEPQGSFSHTINRWVKETSIRPAL